MKKNVIATGNVGKTKEFAEILEQRMKLFEIFRIRKSKGRKNPEENARLKAETIANALQTIVLADI